MSLMKTIPAMLVLAWIAGPIALDAAAQNGRQEIPAATTAAVKGDRIADAFAMLADAQAPRTVTVEIRDEAAATSTLVRMPVVETASN